MNTKQRGRPRVDYKTRMLRNVKRDASGCLIYSPKRNPKYYRTFKINGVNTSAQRASWMIFKGDIPDGLCVLHRCDVPGCVNPEHLFLGTYSDNTQDMLSKGRGKFRYGDRHPESILTSEDVSEIRARRSSGESAWSISKSFSKVKYQTVRAAAVGLNWKQCSSPPAPKQSKAGRLNGHSKFVGVCWDVGRNKWQARALVGGKYKLIGRYSDELKCAQAREAAILNIKGCTAALNFKP